MSPEIIARRAAAAVVCRTCGMAKPHDEWPKYPTGKRYKHCGCRLRVFLSREQRLANKREEGMRSRDKRRGCSASERRQERHQLLVVHRWAHTVHRSRERRRRALHDAHVKTWRADDARRYRWRYAHNPEFVLHERLRRQFRKKAEAVPGLQDIIGRAIRNGNNSPTIERVLGYSMRVLRVHLERQFIDGMTWHGWGRYGWHIDHIHPRKCFDLTTMDGVRSYWALANLRPLWGKDNLKKSSLVVFLL